MRLCPWSLASSIPVLGLERFCPRKGCPWPWPRIFFVSLALASSLVSSTPPLLTNNHLLYQLTFNNNSPPPGQFLPTKCFLKNYLGEMLIEQNIYFELRRPGTPVVHIFQQLVIFMTKQKSVKQILKWMIIHCENVAGGNVPYFPLPAPSHIQNLTPNSTILNVFWTKIVRRIEQFNFFNWLSNFKNLSFKWL